MPRIALTFDDGPNTSTTPQVLDLLEEHGITASFFLIAQNITPQSALQARRAYDMGCTIENHSVTHREMNTMSPDEIRLEIRGCTEKILETVGEAPRFFRPPYISLSQTLFDTVDLAFISGSGCEDWVPEVPAEERARRVLANARDGEIVLLHDSDGNVNTVEALKTIIPGLKARGFTFCTIRQIFDECGITPLRNQIYSNVFQSVNRV